jgi:hypothetical protein
VAEKLVPTAPTKITVGELYAAVRRIWAESIQGVPATRQALVLILAHSALETGYWHAMWNWNLGNAKHVPGDGYDFFAIRHYEVVHGQRVWIDPPHDPFIAFATLDEGASYYLSTLRGRWRGAWPSLLDGDVAGFCHALKIAGYYTAPESDYEAGVFRAMHLLDSSIPPDTVPDVGELAHEAIQDASIEITETEPEPPSEV